MTKALQDAIDHTALGWVKPEIDETLRQARLEIEAFVETPGDNASLQTCAAHLHPEPQVDAGLMLARAGFNARPPALMDVSDGIMRDLPRLLGLTGELSAGGASGRGTLGAEILLARGQLHPEVVRYAELQGKNPVHEALLGGEDYALLGTCAPDMLPPLHAAIPGLTSIGVVTAGGGLVCNNEPLDRLASLRGFDHFDNSPQGA